MRKEHFEKLAEHLEADDAKDVARAMMVDRFGPSCAGWLVFTHRRQIRKAGAFDVVVPHKDKGERYEVPMWFSLAVECLKRRDGWGVQVLTSRKERRFRVRWHRWMNGSVSRETETVFS